MDIRLSWMHLRQLKKLPRRVLVVDMYNSVTERERERFKAFVAVVDILLDFEEQKTNYSLIVLCNTTFKFKGLNPLSIAEGEIWFTRKIFSDDVLADALEYYSGCEIRNGM